MNNSTGSRGKPGWHARYRLRYGKEKSPLLGFLFTAPATLLMCALLFVPLVYQLRLSFFDTSLKNPQPVFFFLDGYFKMLQKPITLKVFTNAIVWTLSVTGLQFLIGMWAALTLNRKFFGRMLLRGLVILPWILPGTVAAMVFRLVFDAQLGFLNTLLRHLHISNGYIDWLGTPRTAMLSVIMVAAWKGFGFSAIMYMAGLKGISQEMYDAASVDGANALQCFWHITLPSMRHIIFTTLILTGIWTFNYFEIIYVLTGGGPLNATHIPPTYIYELAFRNFNMGEAARFAIISILFMGVFSVIYIRNQMKQGEF